MRRRRAWLLAALAAVAAAPDGRADGSASGISWPGWSVTTTEGLWRGRKHTRYPLTSLFDGDAATPWVFSGTTPDASYEVPHALDLERTGEPVVVDGLRIMNGHNRSAELYRTNDRVMRLGVWIDGKKAADARLPDRPGWHAVALPRGAHRSIHLELLEIRKGSVDDVCLGGLELLDGGEPLPMGLPALVIGHDGGEAVSDTAYLMDRRGTRLAADDAGFFGGGAAWDAAARHVASVARGAGTDELWVADAWSGRIVATLKLRPLPAEVPYAIAWHGATVRVRPDPAEAEPGQGEAAELTLAAP
jgi:hypothetical protein